MGSKKGHSAICIHFIVKSDFRLVCSYKKICTKYERLLKQMSEIFLQNIKHSNYSSRSCSSAAKIRDVETANGMTASITANWDKVFSILYELQLLYGFL